MIAFTAVMPGSVGTGGCSDDGDQKYGTTWFELPKRDGKELEREGIVAIAVPIKSWMRVEVKKLVEASVASLNEMVAVAPAG